MRVVIKTCQTQTVAIAVDSGSSQKKNPTSANRKSQFSSFAISGCIPKKNANKKLLMHRGGKNAENEKLGKMF